MTSSNEIDKIALALVAFQEEVGNPKKTADNPFFKSKYADLDEIINTIRPTLAKNGLCIIQSPEGEGSMAKVTTRILHSSGQWIEGTLSLTAVKNDPQGMGSAITYARRYSLAGICGLAQEDDDGNSASGKESGHQAAPTPLNAKNPIGKTPEEGMKERSLDIIKQLGLDSKVVNGMLIAHGGKQTESDGKKHWQGIDWAGVLSELTERQRAPAFEADVGLDRAFDGVTA